MTSRLTLGTGPGQCARTPGRGCGPDKWAASLRAARQFHAREGHLQVPRKAVERIADADGTVTEVRLGTFIDNTRRKADKLSDERRAELTELGMRW